MIQHKRINIIIAFAVVFAMIVCMLLIIFGNEQAKSGTSIIKPLYADAIFPIDTPVSGVEMSARPLIEKLFENVEYLERYHSYMQELIDNYFANGKFAEKVNALDARIGA